MATTSEALSLAAQADQVESKAPVADPVTDEPDNLVLKTELTKPQLLEACKKRFEADGIYTYVADILIAINPYKWIDMYGVNYKDRYAPSNPMCTVPHVYAVAQAASKNLRMLDRNQVCIISGESGSGKTETAKLFMHHLLAYSGASDGHSKVLERQILESQPLLEAFGNAKTGLNNNSSRFGKYIEVLYEDMDRVMGARVKKYLLEKSRVVHQVAGERNFHVFYYLCDGAPAALKKELNLGGSGSYRYLGGEKVDSPAVWFGELERSIRDLGFDDADIHSMWKAVAAILKTGQIDFADRDGSVDDSCQFADEAVAKDLADTLGVSLESLENAMTTKHVVTVGETFHKPLNAELARGNRDTMAQNMYDNLFSWITDSLNALLSPAEDDSDWNSVAVLDIFGFENFRSNGFEQMFINTANEKLQNYFIEHIFTYEVRELKEEGIRAPKIEYTTNVDQVELLLGSRGILALLDEQTKVPNANDDTTIIKMHQELASNASYNTMRNSPVEFQIKHYAGDVTYQVEGYLEKNRNAPSLGIAGMMKSSSDPMIASLFKSSETTADRLKADKAMAAALKNNDKNFMRRESQMHRFGKKKDPVKAEKKDPYAKKLAPWQIKNMEGPKKPAEAVKKPKIRREGSEKRRAGLTTLSAAFKGSLEDLMLMLNSATPHFVRCIKPNTAKAAMTWDAGMVEKQLNYTGVLETTKIRQTGYPLRLPFEEFCARYRDVCIPPGYKLTGSMCESQALRILQSADVHGFGKGKTKMFLKYEHVNVLVDILEGKKRAANDERKKLAAAQAIKDAEAAAYKAKRDAEVAKIRAAAEAQPAKKEVVESGNWQEEMKKAKEKKAAAKKVAEEEAARQAAEAAANPPPAGGGAEDEEAAEKARFAARKAMFGGGGAASPSPAKRSTPSAAASPAAASAPPAPAAAEAADGADAGIVAAVPCGVYKLDMAGKQFGDCKCGFPKAECLAAAK